MVRQTEDLANNKEILLPVDLIRTVAIVLVILLHASIEGNPNLDIMSPNGVQLWWTSNIYDSISRSAVPLFVMLTGALLLQPTKVNEPVGVFFKKRWSRVGIPILFWGTIFFLWDFAIKGQTLTPLFVLQGVFTGPYVHFWFVYALLGLYFITPLLRVIVAYTNWSLIRYFLLLWFVGTGIFSLLTLYENIYSQIVWFNHTVFIFTGLIGYFILGAYIEKLQTRRLILYLGLILSTLWTIIGTYFLVGTLGELYGPFFLDASSFSVIITSVTLFLILASIPNHKIQKRYPRGNRMLKIISENTLPIYLFHIIVLETLNYGYLGFKISVTTLNPIIEIPLVTFLTLLISLAVIIPLKKLPYIKRLIG